MFAVRQSESQLSLMPMCAYEPQRMRNLCEFDSPLSSMIRRMMKAGARGEGRCWCFSDRILCSWKLEVCVDWVPLCLWVWTEPNHRISNLLKSMFRTHFLLGFLVNLLDNSTQGSFCPHPPGPPTCFASPSALSGLRVQRSMTRVVSALLGF